jgi:hypothetical protein
METNQVTSTALIKKKYVSENDTMMRPSPRDDEDSHLGDFIELAILQSIYWCDKRAGSTRESRCS